jgi:hypothetical protein
VVDEFRRPDRSFMTPPAGMPLSSNTFLDIGHESLIRQWGRLGEWAEEESRSALIYQRLKQTAQLWKAGDAALWGYPDLDRALQWDERQHPSPSWAARYGSLQEFEAAMDFLQASKSARDERDRKEREAQALREQEERERHTLIEREKRHRILRWSFIALIVMFLPAVILALLAWRDVQIAKKLSKEAKENAEEWQKRAERAEQNVHTAEDRLKVLEIKTREAEQRQVLAEEKIQLAMKERAAAEKAKAEAEQRQVLAEEKIQLAMKERAAAEKAKAEAEKQLKKTEDEYRSLKQRANQLNDNIALKQTVLFGDRVAMSNYLKSDRANRSIRFLATQGPPRYTTPDGSQMYQFRVFPDKTSITASLKGAAAITYRMEDDPVKPQPAVFLGISGPPGFGVRVNFSRCYKSVVAVIEYKDPEKSAEIAAFDMCALLEQAPVPERK